MTIKDAIDAVCDFKLHGGKVEKLHITPSIVTELSTLCGSVRIAEKDAADMFLGYPVAVSDTFAIVGEVDH